MQIFWLPMRETELPLSVTLPGSASVTCQCRVPGAQTGKPERLKVIVRVLGAATKLSIFNLLQSGVAWQGNNAPTVGVSLQSWSMFDPGGIKLPIVKGE